MNAPGGPGGQQPRGPGGSGSTEDAMLSLKVDPGKLPKAEDLKAHMFPSTVAVAVDDQAVRFITREAFPDIANLAGGGAASGRSSVP